MSKKIVISLTMFVTGILVYSLQQGSAAIPGESNNSISRNAVGTWLLTVTRSSPAPPFQELLTLHADGTLSESNTSLHPNSAIVPDFPFNASEGFGTWRPRRHRELDFKIVKFVFDPDNVHIGYLVVDGVARIESNHFQNVNSDVNILIGPDLDNPYDVIPLGSTEADGKKISIGWGN